MSELTERLDKVASSLESKGFIKEATAIDVISNTLELMGKEAWSADSCPQNMKILSPAIQAISAGNLRAALALLKNGEQARLTLLNGYTANQEAHGFSDNWLEAIKSLETNMGPQALEQLKKATGFLKALEPVINNNHRGGLQPAQQPGQQQPGRPQPAQQQPAPQKSTDMIFSKKGLPPGSTYKKPPVFPPARAMR